jgi:hypothetical protein
MSDIKESAPCYCQKCGAELPMEYVRKPIWFTNESKDSFHRTLARYEEVWEPGECKRCLRY